MIAALGVAMHEAPFQSDSGSPASRRDRAMVLATLMGSHSHATVCGINVHIYQRGDKYLARGRYQGRMFGATLGSSEGGAIVRLRQLLVELDGGSFVPPSEGKKRQLSDGKVPKLTLRHLVSEFLAEKRKTKGERTVANYRARLRPVLDFVETPSVLNKWPQAMDINRNFAIELRAFLHGHQVTRNGRLGAKPKVISAGQIVNVLECLRTVLCWGRQADVRKLPVTWVNPLTVDIIGRRPTKDPLREDLLPIEARIHLVNLMDRWQLCHLAMSVVLPLRPGEATGLLVSDVNFDKGWLQIGTRLEGADFTKGHTSFKLPIPDELRPILLACIGGRTEGPLLRSRKVFEMRKKVPGVGSPEELGRLYQEELAKAPRDSVLAEQDRKRVFRRLLEKLGGVTEDALAKDTKILLRKMGIGSGVSLYTLRSSVSTAMARAKLPHLELRYLTSHTVSDIMNSYVSLDPVGAMAMYFDAVRRLLDVINRQADILGLKYA